MTWLKMPYMAETRAMATNPTMTPKLLDLLDRHNARATFFVVGKYARQHPELVSKVIWRVAAPPMPSESVTMTWSMTLPKLPAT